MTPQGKEKHEGTTEVKRLSANWILKAKTRVTECAFFVQPEQALQKLQPQAERRREGNEDIIIHNYTVSSAFEICNINI